MTLLELKINLNIINSFDNHEYDVLVGTQMITKGLDFKNVQLHGVLNLDSSMNFLILDLMREVFN